MFQLIMAVFRWPIIIQDGRIFWMCVWQWVGHKVLSYVEGTKILVCVKHLKKHCCSSAYNHVIEKNIYVGCQHHVYWLKVIVKCPLSLMIWAWSVFRPELGSSFFFKAGGHWKSIIHWFSHFLGIGQLSDTKEWFNPSSWGIGPI